ncbi:hypothetical protein [Streptomyces sp. NPDC048669]|uniref:hypothetical protein n=1 Tax=Streptomyces sp. NPDC048669 TaxID=3155267 RepID=UPI00341E23A2
MRAAYDPAVRSLRQRELTKAEELEAGGHPASLKLIQRMRGRFEREGALGLVDPRLRSVSDGTGRVDRRVVDALRKVVEDQTSRSTVSAQVLRRRMERALEAEHGPGVVALPSRTTFYRLLSALSSGRHTLGSARTRRSLAKQPDGMFGQLTAARPGEVMDSCYQYGSDFWHSLFQRGYRLSDRAERLRQLSPVTREVRPFDPRRYVAVYPEIVEAISLFASPYWRSLALTDNETKFKEFRAEFNRRLPQERALRTTARAWFLTELKRTAMRVEAAVQHDRPEPDLGFVVRSESR